MWSSGGGGEKRRKINPSRWNGNDERGDSSWVSGGDGGGTSTKHGVEVVFVCDTIPVLTLDTASLFNEHVAAMLQAALSSGAKADSLYGYFADRDVDAACRRIGLRPDDVMVARVKQEDFSHVKAVGTTGKRSVVLALVVGLALDQGIVAELMEMLRSYNIDRRFEELMEYVESRRAAGVRLGNHEDDCWQKSGWEDNEAPRSRSRSKKAKVEVFEPEIIDDAVDLKIVRRNVPLISMGKASKLQEYASWLLQTAMKCDGKVDGIFDYCQDREIMTECRALGFAKEEVCIVRLKDPEFRDIRGVGASGKRSGMLALVIGLYMHHKIVPEQIFRDIKGYDETVLQPFKLLIRTASDLLDRKAGPASKDAMNDKKAGPVSKDLMRDKKAGPASKDLMNAERSQRFDKVSPPLDEARLGECVQKVASTDERPVEGSCTDLEKPHSRIMTNAIASEVRSVDVLRKAYEVVREKWVQSKDWVYTSDMLRSIRQDLTVQMVNDSFTVEVYEFNARAALEFSDFKQFDACSEALENLYADPSVGSVSPNMSEFLAYRLLYLTLQGEALMLTLFLREHNNKLREGVQASEPFLTFACQLRSALVVGNLSKVSKLVPEGPAATELHSALVEGAQLARLANICKSFKGGLDKQLLLGLFGCRPDCHGNQDELLEQVPERAKSFELPPGLPLVFSRSDRQVVDEKRSLNAVERKMGNSKLGARMRLGQARSEHFDRFVRSAGDVESGCPLPLGGSGRTKRACSREGVSETARSTGTPEVDRCIAQRHEAGDVESGCPLPRGGSGRSKGECSREGVSETARSTGTPEVDRCIAQRHEPMAAYSDEKLDQLLSCLHGEHREPFIVEKARRKALRSAAAEAYQEKLQANADQKGVLDKQRSAVVTQRLAADSAVATAQNQVSDLLKVAEAEGAKLVEAAKAEALAIRSQLDSAEDLLKPDSAKLIEAVIKDEVVDKELAHQNSVEQVAIEASGGLNPA